MLPADILLEILSYFHSIPITHFPIDSSTHLHLPVDTALERQDILRDLSQTCRTWRTFFLPLLWENVEMAGIRTGAGPWQKQCHNALVATCKGLAANPNLAQHVRGFRFVLSSQNVAVDLEALVKGIQACPNLRTLCLWFASASTVKTIRAAGLDKHTFVSVEKIVGPDPVSLFLPCCPNVKEIIGPTNATPLVKAMQTRCKSVEVLANFSAGTAILKSEFTSSSASLNSHYLNSDLELVKLAPCLREIRFHSSPGHEGCEVLGKFKHLRVRTEFMGSRPDEDVQEYFVGQLAILKKALRDCSVTMKGGPS